MICYVVVYVIECLAVFQLHLCNHCNRFKAYPVFFLHLISWFKVSKWHYKDIKNLQSPIDILVAAAHYGLCFPVDS